MFRMGGNNTGCSPNPLAIPPKVVILFGGLGRMAREGV